MASTSSNRIRTLAEDQLLIDLSYDHNVSNNPQARYPALNWRHIACFMNEFTSSRAIVKLRLYDAAEVKSRYLDHLQGTRDVAREMEFTGEGEERADEDVEMAEEQETGEE
jgi:hypothetical protein